MAHDPTQDHPDYGRIRGGAKFATQHFEDATELDEAGLDPATDVESNELTGTRRGTPGPRGGGRRGDSPAPGVTSRSRREPRCGEPRPAPTSTRCARST